MRIAGINSPNYQVKDCQHKKPSIQSGESPRNPEILAVPVAISGNSENNNKIQKNYNPVYNM